MEMIQKKTCVIMQPSYLPWIGYFDLIQRSNVFVFLNDVQFSKQSWQVKNKINSQGKELVLTVPVKKTKLATNIDQIIIDQSKPWKKKHLKSIYYSYVKSEFFKEIYPIIEQLFSNQTDSLAEFNMEIIKTISHKLFGQKEFIDSRDLGINSKEKLDRIVQICKTVNATEYLSPAGSMGYLEEMNYKERFSEASLDFAAQNYLPVSYQQISNSDFLPYLSIIDLLFNKGLNESQKTI
jgi:hypothetical protein